MCAEVMPVAVVDQVTMPTVVGAVYFTSLASCTLIVNIALPV